MDELKAKAAELLDQAFALGVASVPTGGISQEQLDAAVAQGKADAKAATLEAVRKLIDDEQVDLKAKIEQL